eukprot:1158693-Pelagomonas_calceolata.AAC.3
MDLCRVACADTLRPLQPYDCELLANYGMPKGCVCVCACVRAPQDSSSWQTKRTGCVPWVGGQDSRAPAALVATLVLDTKSFNNDATWVRGQDSRAPAALVATSVLDTKNLLQ